MIEPLLRKLTTIGELTDNDCAVIRALPGSRVREFAAKSEILRAGDQSSFVLFILSGWSASGKILADGRRQIVALPMESDIYGLATCETGEAQVSLTALTMMSILLIPRNALLGVLRYSSSLTHAFWSAGLTEASIRQEWIVNMGRRRANERMGHLMCELFYRQHVIGKTRNNACALPLTQHELADATGLTPVHVNRTLQGMREAGLISLRSRELVIKDFAALARASMFDPEYLYRWPLDVKRSRTEQPIDAWQSGYPEILPGMASSLPSRRQALP